MPMHGDYVGCAMPARCREDEDENALRTVGMDGHFVWTVNDYSCQNTAILSDENVEQAISVLTGKRNHILLTGPKSQWAQMTSWMCSCGSGLSKMIRSIDADKKKRTAVRVPSSKIIYERRWGPR